MSNLLNRPNRRLEEGESVLIGTCPTCNWQDKAIVLTGDKHDLEQIFLSRSHEATNCLETLVFEETRESNPPDSYLDHRRPTLTDALHWEEGNYPERLESLKRKGYFTPPPRPWVLGFRDRGMGHGDYGVLDKFGDAVVDITTLETAEFIIAAVAKFEAE